MKVQWQVTSHPLFYLIGGLAILANRRPDHSNNCVKMIEYCPAPITVL
jgi:hypothetical protein